ncbi:MAG: hypothetical protein IT307_11110 [Chloroflexi bacterium]|nr:hypothetical protein [Chloroflexota bacterium]
MARKTKRRPFRRPTTQQRADDSAYKRQQLESAAHVLLATRSPEQLRVEVSEREWQLAEADRIAQLDPSPANLTRYRSAQSQYEAARIAMQRLGSRPPGVGDSGN